ncbi:hypothetical protein LOTGIDRAFT_230306 [Lottia gigantea]|uniref:Uncharacterized protein n=1 Tax=Lottia gigantea TaxID=225164 RepID=V4AIV3_LOTGI|nr:hypothetical protein LOTGIDRAFT_230306 [Lottia gigantea]ESP04054.1 hypothetical protein LOTGIDRAFT_230306 [Lottia gigantea]
MACLKLRQALWRFEGAKTSLKLKACTGAGMGTFHLEPEHNVCYNRSKYPQRMNSRLFTSYGSIQHIDQTFLKSHFNRDVKTTSRTFSITKGLLNTSNGIEESELKKGIETISDQFMEAREMMEDARESKGTTYFSEDVEDAQKAVKETLESYQQLLAKISDSQKQQVMRTIGLKMEELKAQLIAMEEDLKEDH